MQSSCKTRFGDIAARTATVLLLAAAVCLAGCGRGRILKQAQELRKSGAADSARVVLREALNERASQMPLWLEYTYTNLELCRRFDDTTSVESTLRYLMEAGLACAAMRQHEQQKPSREWQEATRLASAETARQLARITGQFAAQAQLAEYVNEFERKRDSLRFQQLDMRTERLIAEYRGGVHDLLFQAVVLRQLMEKLPDVTAGSGSVMASQNADAQTQWSLSMELEEQLVSDITRRARDAFYEAFDRALNDLRDVGYFVPLSIFDNGVW